MENSSRFFENRSCRYFPCHEGLADFNCLFCYCPLYALRPCPGTPTYKEKAGRLVKLCTGCTFPHRPENYERVIALLRERKESPRYGSYHHGGELSEAEGVSLDFSVNVNPLGVPAGVQTALAALLSQSKPDSARAALARYPDASCGKLRAALAEKRAVDAVDKERILCGNGASELIALLVAAVNPKSALLLAPSFSGYERALCSRGVAVSYHFLRREESFALRLSPEALLAGKPDMLFLCNPQNPVGNVIEPSLLEGIADACEERHIFLVVDECFLGFVTGGEARSLLRLVPDHPHLIVIDAFTKLYAIPSLRLGYAVTSNAMLLQKMRALQPEWSVSLPAQIAGLAALAEDDYVVQSRHLVAGERAYLSRELSSLGFTVYEGEANFVFFSSINMDDLDLYQQLLEMGLLIRSCADFRGLSGCDYRIAVRKHEDNEVLIKAIKEIRKKHV